MKVKLGKQLFGEFTLKRALALLVVLVFSIHVIEPEPSIKPPDVIAASPLGIWREAANRVEEDRGEPAGRKVQVPIPTELRHYSDRRRFLAVQAAEVIKHNLPVPHDYAELIGQIKQNQLVEMEPAGDDYILYGVGESATEEAFTHYEATTGESIPLFSGDEGFKTELNRLTESIKQVQTEIADLETQIKQLPRRNRAERIALASKLAEPRKQLADLEKKRSLFEAFYKDLNRRKLIIYEYETIAKLAADFGDKSYDLNNPVDRRQFKQRLLSFIRPEARDVLIEIARAYREKFDRHLPVTSLVRTEQYQRHLGKTNPNAARTASPPHTTGLAFDVYYYFMSAVEQEFLMAEIARLKSAGRVEALRETRDHIHVFAFADGRPPAEYFVSRALAAGR
jgi:hypothetical protein